MLPTRRLKAKLILGIGLCFAGFSTASAASIQYQLDLSSGDNSLTGTITTDGTVGQLATSNIVAWDLVEKAGSSVLELTSLNTALHWDDPNVSPISATVAGLFENFVAPGNESLFEFNYTPVPGLGFEGHTDGTQDPNTGIILFLAGTEVLISEPNSIVQIGEVAATPLPATLPLFAGGLSLVGFLSRSRKRNIVPTLAVA